VIDACVDAGQVPKSTRTAWSGIAEGVS
jgi:hypothetical protein